MDDIGSQCICLLHYAEYIAGVEVGWWCRSIGIVDHNRLQTVSVNGHC